MEKDKRRRIDWKERSGRKTWREEKGGNAVFCEGWGHDARRKEVKEKEEGSKEGWK